MRRTTSRSQSHVSSNSSSFQRIIFYVATPRGGDDAEATTDAKCAARARVLATIARLAAVARARVDAARTSCDARSACQVQLCVATIN